MTRTVGPDPEGGQPPRVLLISEDGSALERVLCQVPGVSLTVVAGPGAAHGLTADLIVVDGRDPATILAATTRPPGAYALAVAADPAVAAAAIEAGADDVIENASNAAAVAARVRSLLALQQATRDLADIRVVAEDRLRRQTHDLEEALVEHVQRLAFAAEFSEDGYDPFHTRRVGDTSFLAARAIGMPEEEAATLRLAAPLHDVGKIGIRKAVLNKRDKLDPDELAHLRMHPVYGARILWGAHGTILKMAQEIALCHHERWNGSGYPSGFAKDETPVTARIVAVADVFDALTHERAYKPAWPVEEALEDLGKQRGKELDPDVVEAFVDVVRAGGLDTIGWS